MILPKKHLSLPESYLGFGAYLLEQLIKPMDVDSLWKCYSKALNSNKYQISFSFDDFILVLDFLFIVGAIKEKKGVLSYEVS